MTKMRDPFYGQYLHSVLCYHWMPRLCLSVQDSLYSLALKTSILNNNLQYLSAFLNKFIKISSCW